MTINLATAEQINSAFLPKALQARLQATNPYTFLSKQTMKEANMQVQFGEATINESNQKLEVVFSLIWSQDQELNFVTYNKQAEALGLQKKIYVTNYLAMPFSWFTESQLNMFRARNESKEHLKWVASNADRPEGEKYKPYPNNLMIWGASDLVFVYVPDEVDRKGNSHNGLSLLCVETTNFKGFHQAELSGAGSKKQAVECLKIEADLGLYVPNSTEGNDMFTAKTIQVTPEMAAAAIPAPPPMPSNLALPTVAAPAVPAPTVAAPAIPAVAAAGTVTPPPPWETKPQASKPAPVLPAKAAAPVAPAVQAGAGLSADALAQFGALSPDQQDALLASLKI